MSEIPKPFGSAMSVARYDWLMEQADDAALDPGETAAGWHFCTTAWDGLLIHPVDVEYKFCTCAAHQQHRKPDEYYTRLQEYTDWVDNDGKGRDYPEDFRKKFEQST